MTFEEIFQLIDTALKIGLGALIAGFVTVRVTRLKHQQTVVESAVRRRLELIESVTAGIATFAENLSLYCAVSEKIENAIYQQDGTIGEPPAEWVTERANLHATLESGSALKKAEGLLYLISPNESLPNALTGLCSLADQVVYIATPDTFGDVDFIDTNRQLKKFNQQATALMTNLGKIYRSPKLE